MSFGTYDNAMAYLLDFTDYERLVSSVPATSVFGLERIQALLQFCGNPHLDLRTLHIAGTKGKGSTAAMAAQILTAHGLKVGLYTSPHLQSIRERIQIDGVHIPESALVSLLDELYPYLEASRRQAAARPRSRASQPQDAAPGSARKSEIGERPPSTLGFYKPTFFEILTVLAFLHFLRERVDISIFEVGLGGRLDATNVIAPVACAITTIDFDHMDKLGNTLESIAREKAGILKRGIPAVVSPQEAEALETIERRAAELCSPLLLVGRDIQLDGHNRQLSVRTPNRCYDSLTIPLLGDHQKINAAVAIGLAELAHELDPATTRNALAAVRWPGRVEVFSHEPLVIIDGAHNPASARALVDTLRKEFGQRPVLFVVGISRDKDVEGILRILVPAAARLIFTQARSPRSAKPEELLSTLRTFDSVPASAVGQVSEALDQALASAGRMLVCVTGSFYLAGEARTYLEGRLRGRE